MEFSNLQKKNYWLEINRSGSVQIYDSENAYTTENNAPQQSNAPCCTTITLAKGQLQEALRWSVLIQGGGSYIEVSAFFLKFSSLHAES